MSAERRDELTNGGDRAPLAMRETYGQNPVRRRRSDRLVGASAAIGRVAEQVAVAARGRFPVFIEGEEGTDKELVARLIHAQSDWAQGGFFAIDASLVPETLLERELLGCEARAIAGLPAAFVGALARTSGGTVLIEHIEAVPKDLQQILARAVDSGTVRPINASEDVPIQCRLIASSTESSEALAESGRISAELAERLALLEIRIAPLRERRDDILPVAAHTLSFARQEIAAELGRPCAVEGFARGTLERLREHSWPGNERELREQIRAALRLSRGSEIAVEDLMMRPESADEIPSFRDAKRSFERDYVTRVLRLCKGNISRAARIARKDRKDFYDVMRRNTISPGEFRL